MTSLLKTVDDIPRAWRSALAAVQVAYPEALLAGGALRDRDHGVKVKDLDIFIVSETDVNTTLATFKRHGWVDVHVNGDKSYSGRDRKISGVFDAAFPGAPPVQIIAVTSAITTVLPEIDFGICQIGFDGTRILRTPDYYRDAAAKQFRLVPKVSDVDFVRSLNRWARLKEKYPTWTLHLGSRAEDVVAGGLDASSRPDLALYGVTSYYQSHAVAQRVLQGATDGIHPPFQSGGYIREFQYKDTMPAVLVTGDCEVKVPKHIADRLTKELAHSVRTATFANEVVVRIDGRDAVPASKILSEIVEAKRRFDRETFFRKKYHV